MNYEKLFFCGISNLNKNVEEFLINHDIGGVILYPSINQNYPELVNFFHLINEHGKRLLISSDHEGGQLETIPFIPPFPGNMALGRTNERYAQQYAELSAKIMKAIGFNTIFAPVLDLYTPKNSAVMGFRTFSPDPQDVVRYFSRMVEGYSKEHVLPCVKHFPGHGKALLDSHEGSVVVDSPIDVLKREDFLPFETAVKNGVELIMTSHITYTSVDTLPATLSEEILRNILRKEFGYEGVILSDAMEMKAISDRFSPREAITKFFDAGGDMILLSDCSKNFEVFYKSLKELIREKRLNERELNASVEKVNKLISKYFDPQNIGFIEDVVKNSLEKHVFSLSKGEGIILLMPYPYQMSKADVLLEHYKGIEENAKNIFRSRKLRILKYDQRDPKPIKLDESALIVDIVVDAFKNEKLIKFHSSLPSNTLYIISHDPYDRSVFKGKNYIVTYSTTPISMATVFKFIEEKF